ncbi:MAG: hypothetical protein R3E58_16035 [Phycisphaerae bacterium]
MKHAVRWIDKLSCDGSDDTVDPGQADRYLIDDIQAQERILVAAIDRSVPWPTAGICPIAYRESFDRKTSSRKRSSGFLNSLPNFDPSRSLETYLFTILRYKLVDRLRSKKITPLNIDSEDEDWWDRTLPNRSGDPVAGGGCHRKRSGVATTSPTCCGG